MPTLRPTLAEFKARLTLQTGQEYTIVLPPIAIRVRLVGMLFETDKSFLLPSAMPGIRRLAEIYELRHPKSVLVSGHADRAGSEAHNLSLSVERAESVAAFLQDAADDWMPWYESDKHTAKRWGAREDQHMLSAVVDSLGAFYYTGPITGTNNSASRDAVSRFRVDNGMKKGGVDGATRKLLVQRYMATDGTTLPKGTSISVHGCGESHPSVATADSVALAENRRVEVFFFRGDINPPPVNPCPSGGCAEYPQWVTTSLQTIDVNSEPELAVLLVDELGRPLSRTQVHIELSDGRTEEGSTDEQGIIRPRVRPGTSFELTVDRAHEGGVGDSRKTASGQHFGAGADGPTG